MGITSNFQFIVILIVFAITGSTSAYITRPILAVIGITKDNLHPLIYWPLSLILILPVYKVLLYCYRYVVWAIYFFLEFCKKNADPYAIGILIWNKKISETLSFAYFL